MCRCLIAQRPAFLPQFTVRHWGNVSLWQWRSSSRLPACTTSSKNRRGIFITTRCSLWKLAINDWQRLSPFMKPVTTTALPICSASPVRQSITQFVDWRIFWTWHFLARIPLELIRHPIAKFLCAIPNWRFHRFATQWTILPA